MIRSAMATFVTGASALTASAESPRDAWMLFELETAVFPEPPAALLEAYVDAYWERHRGADDAMQRTPHLIDEVMAKLEADRRLKALEEEPEWLHGLDLVSVGQKLDLLEQPDDAEEESTNQPETHIWVVGWDGLILHSKNEGVEFEHQQSGTTRHLQAVDFVDETHGFAAGHRGSVLRTRDGGKSWHMLQHALTRFPRAPGDHFSIDCIDRNDCWLAGNYASIKMTRDAGATWSNSSVVATNAAMRHVLRLSPEVGLAAGNHGISRTKSAGTHWSTVHTVASNSSHQATDAVFAMDSADGRVVWAVGSEGGTLAILKSDDAGQTWQSQSANIFSMQLNTDGLDALRSLRANDVSAVDSQRAFVVGQDGLILSTVDGGLHWWVLRLANDPTDSFYALEMRDARVGWVAGNYGNVMGTNSGGRLWTRLRGYLNERTILSLNIFETLQSR